MFEAFDENDRALIAQDMKGLTASEKDEVEKIMKLTPAGSMPDAEPLKRMKDLGMYYWLVTRSAQLAFHDADCRRVAEAFWDQQNPTTSCLVVAHAWFVEDAVTRDHALRAVRLNTPAGELTPAARKAVIALGGQKWLER